MRQRVSSLLMVAVAAVLLLGGCRHTTGVAGRSGGYDVDLTTNQNQRLHQ